MGKLELLIPPMSLFCPKSFSFLARDTSRSLTHLLPSPTPHLRHVLSPRPFHNSARRSFKTIEEARSRTRSGVIPSAPTPLIPLYSNLFAKHVALLVTRLGTFSHRGRGDDILFSI